MRYTEQQVHMQMTMREIKLFGYAGYQNYLDLKVSNYINFLIMEKVNLSKDNIYLITVGLSKKKKITKENTYTHTHPEESLTLS